ncbi:SCO0268 family class II lanthipeptide [Streptomyces sp. NPDC102370]|uniref:SCO0268 family class II lanthipeptide n=1 Tax=Streptomyces sp. NPDC102370 TaxID=3366163 RepID=UPI003829B76D
MRTEIVLSQDAPELDLDLDLRVSDLPEQAESFLHLAEQLRHRHALPRLLLTG